MNMTQQRLNTNDYYSTSDLALAAAISLYYPLEVINHSDPRKAEFLFKRNSGMDGLIESFWNRKLQVDALTYFNQLRIVKSRLYEENKR